VHGRHETCYNSIAAVWQAQLAGVCEDPKRHLRAFSVDDRIMKLSLQLKLGQQLTMTPQLQQAIKLLQLSTIDLQQEIHQALESNPML
jgi:hypothetical protein